MDKKVLLIILIVLIVGIYLSTSFSSIKTVDESGGTSSPELTQDQMRQEILEITEKGDLTDSDIARVQVLTNLLSSSQFSLQVEHHSPPTAVIEQGSGSEAASYIIFHDDETPKLYYAKNGSTGAIEFSGTDAATVINNALNALTSGRTWKEQVVLKGDFSIDSTITVPSYTSLIVFGKMTLADSVNIHMFDFSNNSYIEVINGNFVGNRANQDSASSGFLIEGASYINWENCIIENFYQDGIYGMGLKYSTVENCIFKDSKEAGLAFLSSAGFLAKNNVVSRSYFGNNSDGSTYDGIRFAGVFSYYTENNLVYANTFENNDDYDISLNVRSRNNTIRNNIVLSSTNLGFIDNDGSDNVIKGNIGFVTENSGTATNSTATTFVFNHGLAGTPTGVWSSFNTTAITGWAWTATSTQITITVTGTLPSSMTAYWNAIYKP